MDALADEHPAEALIHFRPILPRDERHEADIIRLVGDCGAKCWSVAVENESRRPPYNTMRPQPTAGVAILVVAVERSAVRLHGICL